MRLFISGVVLVIVVIWVTKVVHYYLPWFGEGDLGCLRENAEDVSLIRLIVCPDEYAGRPVRVHGYLWIEFEGNALYISCEDFNSRNSKSSVAINADSGFLERVQKYRGHYVIVEGVFDTTTGHMGARAGTIRNINRVILVR
jgi:hypothetical protein